MTISLKNKYANIALLILLTYLLSGCSQTAKDIGSSFTITPIEDIEISANTGDKPQSKIWFHDNSWWAVLPNQTGTKLWQLQNNTWIEKLHLSDSIQIKADTKVYGNLAHILLFMGPESELISLEYDIENKLYIAWNKRPKPTKIQLEKDSETATIEIDPSERMWLASDDDTVIFVRWSDPPYNKWSEPITLATDISKDDICVTTVFPDGNIAVLWSNQNTKHFGFRVHKLGADPKVWSEDEVPASQSTLPVKGGMADDHLNIAMASNGTLYAAVKTSYDSVSFPLIALLIRQASGTWDELYFVDDYGTRPIVLLNKKEDEVMVFYTSHHDTAIVCKRSLTEQISFGSQQSIISGKERINNVSSTKQNFSEEIVILASEAGIVKSAHLK